MSDPTYNLGTVTKNTDVEEWATKRGFASPVRFAGGSTVIGGDPNAAYAGFYLLNFDNGDYYLGESVNIRGRMAGHKTKWGSEIVDVRPLVQNLSKPQLRERERTLIHELNKVIPDGCRNVADAGVTADRDELADIIDASEQSEWRADPHGFNMRDGATLKPMVRAQETKYSTAARKFRERNDHVDLVRLLRTYLDHCVPAPRRTEFHSWSVSCGTYQGKRTFCVSVGKMEAFVAFAAGGGFIVARESVLFPTANDGRRFRQRHPLVHVKKRRYEDSGVDTVSLWGPTVEELLSLLADPAVSKGVATLTFDVMRKHPCVYTRYHCPQLVEMVYSDHRRPVAEAGLAVADAGTAGSESHSDRHVSEVATITEAPPAEIESVEDGIPIVWFVNAGPAKTRRNTVVDFIANSEWRMDPQDRYEVMVQDMLPGERIVVRKRYNTKNAPFATRGHLVSAMDILLTGTVVANPGDGCSVSVAWDTRPDVPRTWYLYTNQDPVWAIPFGPSWWGNALIEFALTDASQDLEMWRNLPFWSKRFGDR